MAGRRYFWYVYATIFTMQGDSTMPKTPLEDFKALIRHAGLELGEAQTAELYSVWGYIEEMLVRIRTPLLAREAEPSHVFKPEDF